MLLETLAGRAVSIAARVVDRHGIAAAVAAMQMAAESGRATALHVAQGGALRPAQGASVLQRSACGARHVTDLDAWRDGASCALAARHGSAERLPLRCVERVEGGAQGRFKLAYPQSWEHEVAPSHNGEISGIHLRMLDAQQQTLMAYLLVRAKRVSAMPQRSLGALIEATITMLGHSEIRPAGTLQPPSDAEDPRAVTVDGWIGGVIGDGTLGTAPITLRLGFMERDNVVFTLALCSPKLENDPLTAFRATRAFELARLTIELIP